MTEKEKKLIELAAALANAYQCIDNYVRAQQRAAEQLRIDWYHAGRRLSELWGEACDDIAAACPYPYGKKKEDGQ